MKSVVNGMAHDDAKCLRYCYGKFPECRNCLHIAALSHFLVLEYVIIKQRHFTYGNGVLHI